MFVLVCLLQNEGRLEVSPDYVIWTPRAGDGGSAGKRTVDLRKLSTASWTDVGRTCQLFLRDKEGGLLRFEGFKSTDFEAVDNAIASSRAGVKLEKMKMGVKGGNWGDWEINGKQLEWREIVLDDDGEVTVGNLVASIPLETIAQAQSMAKGDIDIQFLEDGESAEERQTEGSVGGDIRSSSAFRRHRHHYRRYHLYHRCHPS